MSGEAFLTTMPCRCTSGGKLRLGDRHAVLHLHLRDVEIRAELERDGQLHVAVVGALAGHVEHVLHAVDLLLDRRGDGLGDGLGVGAGIAGGDGDRGRRDLRILRDRQREDRDRADDDVTIESTAAKTGRSMKKWANFIEWFRRRLGRWRGGGIQRGLALAAVDGVAVACVAGEPGSAECRRIDLDRAFGRRDFRARPGVHLAVDDDAIVGVQIRETIDRKRAKQRAELHRARLDHVVLVHDQHVSLVLIVADRRVRHEQRLISAAAGDSHAGEKSGREQSRLDLENAAGAQRAGGRIDMVVHEIDHTHVREPVSFAKLHEAGNLAHRGR